MSVRAALMAVAALAATACDTWSSVSHEARLPGRPDYACVRRVIAENPAVEPKTLVREEAGVVRMGYLVKANGEYVDLYFDEHWAADRTDFRHAIGRVNQTLPQEIADAARPIMISIERQIEQSCSIAGLRSSMREYCTWGVSCAVAYPEASK